MLKRLLGELLRVVVAVAEGLDNGGDDVLAAGDLVGYVVGPQNPLGSPDRAVAEDLVAVLHQHVEDGHHPLLIQQQLHGGLDVLPVLEQGADGGQGGLHHPLVLVVQAGHQLVHRPPLHEAEAFPHGAEPAVDAAEPDDGQLAAEAGEDGAAEAGVAGLGDPRQAPRLLGEVLQRQGGGRLDLVLAAALLQHLGEEGAEVVILAEPHDGGLILQEEGDPREHADEALQIGRQKTVVAGLPLVDPRHLPDDDLERLLAQQAPREPRILLGELGQEPDGSHLLLRGPAVVGNDPDQAPQLPGVVPEGVGQLLAHERRHVVQELYGRHAEVPLGHLDELDQAHDGADAPDHRDDALHRPAGACETDQDLQKLALNGGAGVADQVQQVVDGALGDQRLALIPERDGLEVGPRGHDVGEDGGGDLLELHRKLVGANREEVPDQRRKDARLDQYLGTRLVR